MPSSGDETGSGFGGPTSEPSSMPSGDGSGSGYDGPYVSGGLIPSGCYTHGGSTMSVTIADLDQDLDFCQDLDLEITFQDINGNVTSAVDSDDVVAHFQDGTLDLAFLIPSSPDNSDHTETVVIQVSDQIVTSQFQYKALPVPTIEDIDTHDVDFYGDTVVTMTVSNLGFSTSTAPKD